MFIAEEKLTEIKDLKPDVKIVNSNSIIPIVDETNHVIGGVRNVKFEDGWLVGDVGVLDEQTYQESSVVGMFYAPVEYSTDTTNMTDQEAHKYITQIHITKIIKVRSELMRKEVVKSGN